MRGPVSSSGPVPRGPVVSGPVVKFILILLSQCFDFTLFCVCNSLFVLLLFLVYHTDYNRSFFGEVVFCFSLFFDYSISHTLQQKYNKINLFCISIFSKCLDFGLFNMAKGGGVSKRNIENSKENLFFLLYYSKAKSRAVSAVLTICVTISVIVCAALHIFAVSDLVVTGAYVNIFMGITAVVFIVLLSREIRSSRQALLSMIMWTPMIMALILDIFNQFISFSSLHFFTYGLAVTMIAQIVRTVFDLCRKYLESIHYQQMQKELYEAKVQVMVSQIRPHFMYNALSSIAMLCKIKPETAYEATIKFSDYLRGNMDSLKQTAPVPFKKELEHLEKYLYIEKLRFGKKLSIEYDIQEDNFEIPLLSVQPLVENAVKHGVGMKDDGGTVTIASRETDDSFEVIVSDDGVGFDVNEVKDDGRSHVGMENTKRRLKDMCNAEVVITSTVGEGTTAKIIIPKVKEETKNENNKGNKQGIIHEQGKEVNHRTDSRRYDGNDSSRPYIIIIIHHSRCS